VTTTIRSARAFVAAILGTWIGAASGAIAAFMTVLVLQSAAGADVGAATSVLS
jgi:hypothetical protein